MDLVQRHATMAPTRTRPILLAAIFLLGVSGAAYGQQAFNDSIASLADRIRAGLIDAGKPRVAVAPLNDPSNEFSIALTTYVEEILIMHLSMSGHGLVIVDRRGLGQVMDEQRRAAEGTFDENSAIEAGRLLAADALITGSMYRLDERMHLIVRMLDTGTGQLIGSVMTFTTFPDGRMQPSRLEEPMAQKANLAIPRPEQPSRQLEYRAGLMGASFFSRGITGLLLETSYRTRALSSDTRGRFSIGFQLSIWPSVGQWRDLPFDVGYVQELRASDATGEVAAIQLGKGRLQQNDLFLITRSGTQPSATHLQAYGLEGMDHVLLDIYRMSNVRMSMYGVNFPMRFYMGRGQGNRPATFLEGGIGWYRVRVGADYEMSTHYLRSDATNGDHLAVLMSGSVPGPMNSTMSNDLVFTNATFGGGFEAGRFSMFLLCRFLVARSFNHEGRKHQRVRGNIIAFPVLANAANDGATMQMLASQGVMRYGVIEEDQSKTGDTSSSSMGNGIMQFWHNSNTVFGIGVRLF